MSTLASDFINLPAEKKAAFRTTEEQSDLVREAIQTVMEQPRRFSMSSLSTYVRFNLMEVDKELAELYWFWVTTYRKIPVFGESVSLFQTNLEQIESMELSRMGDVK